MTELLIAVVVVALLAAALGALVLLAGHARRRGTAGSAIAGAMAAYDEGMHSTAHDAFVSVQEQDRRVTPVEAPDGASKRPSRG